jgi:hypothetical protein
MNIYACTMLYNTVDISKAGTNNCSAVNAFPRKKMSTKQLLVEYFYWNKWRKDFGNEHICTYVHVQPYNLYIYVYKQAVNTVICSLSPYRNVLIWLNNGFTVSSRQEMMNIRT